MSVCVISLRKLLAKSYRIVTEIGPLKKRNLFEHKGGEGLENEQEARYSLKAEK